MSHKADFLRGAARMGSIARSNNISVSVISEAMGHDSEATTRIYLASLDTSPVDNANDVVMNSIG